MKRNVHFSKLTPTYLFQEVNKRTIAFKKSHPDKKLISLSIGDTTSPIPASIVAAMQKKASALATIEGYTGYGNEQGEMALREKISEIFYGGKILPDEIFISDGAKCDLGRLQLLIGSDATVALFDPAYPVYHDTSIVFGCKKLLRLPLTAENDFFPDLEEAKEADVLFLSTPNNPIGTALTFAQMQKIVDFAKSHEILLIIDVAYNLYIDDPNVPKSIYEIPGAKEVAIEVGSFSKLINFTGVRLGWSVIPHALEQGAFHRDWQRIQSTFFNGASNVAQAGALAALQSEGYRAMLDEVSHYKANAQLILKGLKRITDEVYGGVAPFLWVRFKEKMSSWELFEYFLHKYQIVTTPGSGFGPSGEGFLRFTSLGKRENIVEALSRL